MQIYKFKFFRSYIKTFCDKHKFVESMNNAPFLFLNIIDNKSRTDNKSQVAHGNLILAAIRPILSDF